MKFMYMPGDVILEITRFLDLHDSFHLLVTCSSLASLLSLKDFWMKTLICVIPGTNMVIANDYERLTCWNTQCGACLAELEMDKDGINIYEIGQSPASHLPGHSFIALSSSNW
ncbi:hypothetical protein B0H12DRAFT_439261 [Mycena haematopus]|nr:hypothetical protein B0H12DRAFT_439261 [Mycena haematopus]